MMTTLAIVDNSRMGFTKRPHDIKHNDIQDNDTQLEGLICDTQHN
jgi:hypothetical protein